jgi:hypothetical protein
MNVSYSVLQEALETIPFGDSVSSAGKEREKKTKETRRRTSKHLTNSASKRFQNFFCATPDLFQCFLGLFLGVF